MATAGVYKIEHRGSGKVYVGSAGNCARRFCEHRYALRKNRHRNKRLQNAWNAHGESSFQFAIILVCRPQDCSMYEQSIIDFWRTTERGKGYNIREMAERNTGIKFPGADRSWARRPENVERMRSLGAEKMADPAHRAKVAAGREWYRQDPGARKFASEQLKKFRAELASDPEKKAAFEEKRLAALREKTKGIPIPPASREKMRVAAKARWARGRGGT